MGYPCVRDADAARQVETCQGGRSPREAQDAEVRNLFRVCRRAKQNQMKGGGGSRGLPGMVRGGGVSLGGEGQGGAGGSFCR